MQTATYAERCEDERLAARITQDILTIPELEDIGGEQRIYGRQWLSYIAGDDGDPHFMALEA